MSGDDAQYFAADYQQARQKFLAACSVVGADLDSLRHPQSGPDGSTLYTDVAVLGPSGAEAALVLQSATHGGEGFSSQDPWLGFMVGGAVIGLAAIAALLPALQAAGKDPQEALRAE